MSLLIQYADFSLYSCTSGGLLLCRYFMLGGAVVILGLGLPSRPDTSIMTWAKRQAQKELAEEAEA